MLNTNRIDFLASIKDKTECIDNEYFDFEKRIFGAKYASAPENYQEFLQFFKRDFHLFSARKDEKLIGCAFLDVVVPNQIYYLRVLGVDLKFRGLGISASIIEMMANALPRSSIIAFVSETDVVEDILLKNGSFRKKEFKKTEPPVVYEIISYNPKLKKANEGCEIIGYYKTHSGSKINGKLYIVERI